MGGAFSSSKPAKKPPGGTISNVDRAMLDLKNSRDRLSRYKARLEVENEKLLQRAKQAKQLGKTNTALQLLQLRKFKQRQVESVDGQLLTVLQMVETMDSKQNEAQVLQALKTGKDALHKMHQETTVDDVLELMDQIQEEAEVEQQISEILQGNTDLSVEDEAAVEAELAALEEEVFGKPEELDLPTVPTNKLPETKVQEPAAAAKPERVAVAS